ncbi:MAG: iron ABC transporter permease [Cardiobacteriaceae bacterium]|nr:iron ABC transporter permease [Cardiobacteriaceae bacterium]
MPRHILFPLLALLLLASLALALHSGSAALPYAAWHCQSPQCAGDHYILWHIRLPRVLAALLVGAALAVCGAAMQGLFRNPLVDPGIVGISSGAALAAALYIVLLAPYLPHLRLYGLPVAAFAGGWGATLLLYHLSRRHGQIHIAIMLLTGIALAAFAGALTGLLVYLSNDNQLRDLTFWGMGSLAGLNWPMLAILATLIILTLPVILRDARALNALALGEAAASHTGFAIATVKRRLILCVALLTGASVAFAGGIGFVGLVVPHLMRLASGSDHRTLLPASLLAGATLLILADTLARTLIAPAELPIGVLTALLGAPFLGYLVWQSGVRHA